MKNMWAESLDHVNDVALGLGLFEVPAIDLVDGFGSREPKTRSLRGYPCFPGKQFHDVHVWRWSLCRHREAIVDRPLRSPEAAGGCSGGSMRPTCLSRWPLNVSPGVSSKLPSSKVLPPAWWKISGSMVPLAGPPVPTQYWRRRAKAIAN